MAEAHPDVRAGVILLAMGGPRNAAEVGPFLQALFADRRMIRLPLFMRPFQDRLARRVARRRVPTVAPKYAAIGHSPLVETTEALAQALQHDAQAEGLPLAVWAGMRYGPPRAPEVLTERLREWNGTRDRPVVLLPQYPFFSDATTGSSLDDAAATVAALGQRAIRVERYGDHPAYIDLIADSVRTTWQEVPTAERDDTHLLFTAHGLPESYVRRGDPYRAEVERSFAAVVERLQDIAPRERIHLSFQSRVGPVRWLRPYTDETIRSLGAKGVRRLVVVPFGFTCEHLETLEEIDILYRGLAHGSGIMDFHRVPAPGTDPRFIRLQLDLVREALQDHDRGA